MAMEAEALPVCRMLSAHEVPGSPPLPLRLFEAHVGECLVVVAVNGRDPRHGVDSIGTEAAAVTTYEVVRRYEPELVVSAGTAGGWSSRGAFIGDVYVSRDRFVHHDRRIAMPGWDAYGVGGYPVADMAQLAVALNLKQGLVTTSNSLDENEDDRRMIAVNGGEVKEMEAAAVAYVADLMNVPMMALKAITDLVDHHTATAEQFAANLALASQRLAEVLVEALRFLAGPVGNGASNS